MRNLGSSGGPPRTDGGSPPTRVRTPLLPRGRSSYGVVTRDPQAKPPPSLCAAAPPTAPKTPNNVKKIANIPEHLMKGDQPITAQAVLAAQRPPTIGGPVPVTDDDESDEKGKGGSKVRPGGVIGRDQRRAQRDVRSRDRKDVGVQLQGGQVVVLEDDRPGRKLRRPKLKPKRGTEPRKGKVQITPPITIRACAKLSAWLSRRSCRS